MQPEGQLVYWRVAKSWWCAVPRDDLATSLGFSWKTHGLIGRGKTQAVALADWREVQRLSDLVADIY